MTESGVYFVQVLLREIVVPIVSFDKVVAVPDKLRLEFLGKAGWQGLDQMLSLSTALGSLEIFIMVWSVFDVRLAGRPQGQTWACFAGRHDLDVSN